MIFILSNVSSVHSLHTQEPPLILFHVDMLDLRRLWFDCGRLSLMIGPIIVPNSPVTSSKQNRAGMCRPILSTQRHFRRMGRVRVKLELSDCIDCQVLLDIAWHSEAFRYSAGGHDYKGPVNTWPLFFVHASESDRLRWFVNDFPTLGENSCGLGGGEAVECFGPSVCIFKILRKSYKSLAIWFTVVV